VHRPASFDTYLGGPQGATGGRHWIGGVLVALGVIGIAAFAYLLATSGGTYDGIPERVAVDAVMASELIAAVALPIGRRATPSSPTLTLTAG
jgi:hypothetical protein